MHKMHELYKWDDNLNYRCVYSTNNLIAATDDRASWKLTLLECIVNSPWRQNSNYLRRLSAHKIYNCYKLAAAQANNKSSSKLFDSVLLIILDLSQRTNYREEKNNKNSKMVLLMLPMCWRILGKWRLGSFTFSKKCIEIVGGFVYIHRWILLFILSTITIYDYIHEFLHSTSRK